jgi:large subunit ribosomal protein L17
MFKNLASSLILTERASETEPSKLSKLLDPNPPKVAGRVVTTLEKAKEVRPLVEKCVTIAKKALVHQAQAAGFATTAERNTAAWKEWRSGEKWQQWNRTIAPAVAARRQLVQLLGDKNAVRVLMNIVAPRYADRPGGYTRILRLATPRLGDAGTRAIIEFVGKHDRVSQVSQRPSFSGESTE